MNTDRGYDARNVVRKEILLRLRTACLLVWTACAVQAQEIPANSPTIVTDRAHMPRVVVLSMGGMLASRSADRMNLTDSTGAGRVPAAEWLQALPELQNLATVTAEDLPMPKSGWNSAEELTQMIQRLRALSSEPQIDGIVVAHGTGTLAEAAFFANLLVGTDKPIVFAGAQRPWSGISGDGPLNLYDAVRVASDSHARKLGVLVCMNQYIHAARDVTMTNAYRVEAMKGVDTGALGFADPDEVRFYRAPTRVHTTESEFAGADATALPAVEIVYAYGGGPGILVDAAVERGARGLVLDGFGRGEMSDAEHAAVQRAQAKGVVVVVTTRTGGGRVQETPTMLREHLVNGDNLPPEKARLLLQLALSRTQNWDRVKHAFDVY